MSLRRSLVALVAAAGIVVGCSSADDSTVETTVVETTIVEEVVVESTAAAPVTVPDPITIGLVAPSSRDDRAWTQAMVDSIERVGLILDIELVVAEGPFDSEGAAAEARGFAADGADLVIVHGIEFVGAAEAVADEFPDISFAVGPSTDASQPNVFAYAVAAEEGGYVNGALAAQLTETNVIGVVGPLPVGDAKRYIDGFVAGVAARNSAAEVLVTFIDSFADAALSAEAANAHLEAGADVLTGISQMSVGAAKVAFIASVPWFGTQWEQPPTGQESVVATQTYRWDVVLEQMLDRIANGITGGEAFAISYANGGLTMAYSEEFDLAESLRLDADSIVAGLADGSIDVPVAP